MRPSEVVARVGNDLELLADDAPLVFSDHARKRIDEIWGDETRRRGRALYDAPIMYFHRHEGNKLFGRFMRYKEFLAIRGEPDILPGVEIQTIGVSGLIFCDDAVAFARRSKDVRGYPGMYELVPSGNIDREFIRDGRVDYRAQLAAELREETGVGAEHIVSMETFALILDGDDRAYDICAEIKTDLRAKEFLRIAETSGQSEYEGIEFIRLNALDQFIHANRERIIPTSLAMLEVWRR